MSIDEALRKAITQLKLADIDSAKLDAELLLAHILKTDREHILAHDDQELSSDQIDALENLIKQRAKRIPLVHLTKTREFYGLDLEITPAVLTPRVETEQMVEWAIKYALADSKLIDIGTGSGAIAIAIAKHRPDLEVWATEVAPEPLAVAKRNAAKHKMNIKFVQSDLFNSVGDVFETIVTNLPYLQTDADLMPEVLREPAVALFGGDDGLDLYRKFLQQLPAHLAAGGHLFTECDPWQQEKLIEATKTAKLAIIEQGYFIMGFVKQ